MVMALPLTLTRAREKVLAPFRDLVSRYGITEPQWRVLRTIGTVGPLDPSALTQITSLLFPSLSRIIRDLEDRNLVSKTVDPDDQRRYVVSLTETGQQLFDAIVPDCERVYATIRQSIGADKLRELHSLLIELESQLDDVTFPEFNVPDAALQDAIGPIRQRGRPKAVKA